MANLASAGETLRVLDKFGIRARKKFGQNFLINENVILKSIEAAGIGPEDCVLEIGPGIGTMTGLLSEAAGHVISVEIDTSLEPVLADTLQDCDNVTIIWQDILKTDLAALSKEYNEDKPFKTVANLPYYITTPILMKLLEERGLFQSITVMVQKEVADRIRAVPGTKEYGAITLAVQYYAEPELVTLVPPSCFIPRPGVDSAVLCLRARQEPPVDAPEKFLFAVIRASFNQRRKTLANGIANGLQYGGRNFTRAEAEHALEAVGLPVNVRGEKLSLEEFAAFSKALLGE